MSAETSQLWRVVLDNGSVREVRVFRNYPWPSHPNPSWIAVGSKHPRDTARGAVAALAVYVWPVREILAPGELSRDEAVAAAILLERQGCAQAIQAMAAGRSLKSRVALFGAAMMLKHYRATGVTIIPARVHGVFQEGWDADGREVERG